MPFQFPQNTRIKSNETVSRASRLTADGFEQGQSINSRFPIAFFEKLNLSNNSVTMT
jgi:hypothetical protein